jgi:hypothetical protein
MVEAVVEVQFLEAATVMREIGHGMFFSRLFSY